MWDLGTNDYDELSLRRGGSEFEMRIILAGAAMRTSSKPEMHSRSKAGVLHPANRSRIDKKPTRNVDPGGVCILFRFYRMNKNSMVPKANTKATS